MLLTDLIADKHLKFLGDVEWLDDGSRLRLVFYQDFMGGGKDIWFAEVFENDAWRMHSHRSPHVASCILEHAIRVKLLASERYIYPAWSFNNDHTNNVIKFTVGHTKFNFFEPVMYDTEPEALIAAMDSLIEKEKDEA